MTIQINRDLNSDDPYIPEIAKATDVAFVDATTENLKATQIDIFGYINNSHCAMLDNIKVSESDATTSATE